MQNGRVSTPDSGPIMPVPAGRRGGGLGVIVDFWKAYGEKIAYYQTAVILTIIYGIVVGPIWAAGRLTGHQFLPLHARSATSFWLPTRMGGQAGLEELKKQG